MKILCRADASIEIGLGHVMRLMTLASKFQLEGHDSTFAMREHEGNLISIVKKKGFNVISMPVNVETKLGDTIEKDAQFTRDLTSQIGADWVFVDHYETNYEWESAQIQNTLALEDLIDRKHACKILLNQNLNAEKLDYSSLLNSGSKYLGGARYALIRPEFLKFKQLSSQIKRRQKDVLRILISLGGTDQKNATLWVLRVLEHVSVPGKNLHLDIVLGPTSPHSDTILDYAKSMSYSTEVWLGNSNMAHLMAESDFSVGAAGSTTWERCVLAVPSIVIVLAENQRDISKSLEQKGAGVVVEFGDVKKLEINLKKFIADFDFRLLVSRRAAGLIDGMGCQRVFEKIMSLM